MNDLKLFKVNKILFTTVDINKEYSFDEYLGIVTNGQEQKPRAKAKESRRNYS